ncbi:uncharacterized protein NEMAJ01_2115 [Nematocida major]|uniref:uncharacterized protein n=1 Tax=Nematocida major TaxID=1912982 RepID=UPI002008C30C|nr:uncharacterized protein NEMAJ01_2115 [Nematocida major]KAH9387219.1 hypothetical protein NEMAJ01_2115 [Nematocida major]
MKRLSGRKPAASRAIVEEKDVETKWYEVEGFSGWFVYKMSKYFSLGMYPVCPVEASGRKLKARNKLNLSKVVGKIGVLDLCNICRVKGTLSDCVIDSIRIKNTEMSDDLWRLVKRSKTVVLHDVGIARYREEYFDNAVSIDVLGSSVDQIGNRVIDLINTRRKRIRIADSKILIFWDENKCSTCVIRHFDVYRILQRIPVIRVIHFDGIEITMSIIKEMRRHPIATVKLIGCKILPMKIYDLVDTCRATLTTIEFTRTLVSVDTVEYLRSRNLTVTVSTQ